MSMPRKDSAASPQDALDQLASADQDTAETMRPDMPDYGTYLRWPVEGEDWIHEDDIETARRLVPSNRIFKRESWDGAYYHLRYGKALMRVQPTMWISVPQIDVEVGQRVELLSKHGEHDPGIFHIHEIRWNARQRQIHYSLGKDGLILEQQFERNDFKALDVRYDLRQGFFQHTPPKSDPSAEVDYLNVGKLTDEKS